jgi:hypothetical protein
VLGNRHPYRDPQAIKAGQAHLDYAVKTCKR